MRLDPSLKNTLQEASLLYAAQVGEVEDYLDSRGIPLETAMRYRLGYVRDPYSTSHDLYTGRLSIPYLTRAGVVNMRFRCIEAHNCKDLRHGKYMGLPKLATPIYNVEALFSKASALVVSEGEIDALVSTELVGVPAIGLPGANGWKSFYSNCLADFREVVVVGDGDPAGREMVAKLTDEIDQSRGVVLPDGHDINSLYLEAGPFAVLDILGLS